MEQSSFILIFAVIVGFSAAATIITEAQFKDAVKANGNPSATTKQYNAFVKNIHKAGISTKEEAAMALAQFIHESDRLRAKREYACVKSGCPRKYKSSACDVHGKTYYGRGYIQLTWCSNYREASKYLYGNEKLVKDPDLVGRDEDVAWETAFWFWKVNVHNRKGVSKGKFGVTTRAINSGECRKSSLHRRAKNRFEMYKKVRKAFGLSGHGNESGCYN